MDKNSVIYNDNNLKTFLDSFIDVVDNSKNFIQICQKNDKKKLMLNLLYWYIHMADILDLPDSAKLTFLISMAEANIKIKDDRYDNEDFSTNDIKSFFCCMSENLRNEVQQHIKLESPIFSETRYPNSQIVNIVENQIDFDKIVDILLNVRHRFVHGKNIYCFRFNEIPENFIYQLNGETGPKNQKQPIKYKSTLTYKILRDSMIKTALENIKQLT